MKLTPDDNKHVCSHFHNLAIQAVKEWDGQDSVDLILDILSRTGEPPLTTLREAIKRWRDKHTSPDVPSILPFRGTKD